MMVYMSTYPVQKETHAKLKFDSGNNVKIALAAGAVLVSSLCIFPYLYGSASVSYAFLFAGSILFSLSLIALVALSRRHYRFVEKVGELLLESNENWWQTEFQTVEKEKKGTNFKNEKGIWIYFVKEGDQKTLIFCATPELVGKWDEYYAKKSFTWLPTATLS